MQRLIDAFLVGPSSGVGLASLLLLAVIMTADAVCRGAGVALVGASEVSGVLLACLIFFSIGHVQRNNGHVAIEAVVAFMPPRIRRIAEFVTLIACFALSVVIVYGTILEAVSSHQKMEYQYGTLPFPLWPIKAIVAFGFLVLVIQQAVQLIQMFQVVSGRVQAPDDVRISAERSI